jgi:hypothetical protein
MRYRSATVTGFHDFSQCPEHGGVKRTSGRFAKSRTMRRGKGGAQEVFHARRGMGRSVKSFN